MWKWIVILLAVCGAIDATWMTLKGTKAEAPPPLRQEVVRKPYVHAIVGAGLVEPESENIVMGVRNAGFVVRVYVKKGQAVKAGDPLFKTCTEGLEADKATAEAALRSAQAQLRLVEAYQRPEVEPQLRAKLDAATALAVQAESGAALAEATVVENEWNVKDHQSRLKRLEATVQANASPQQDLELEQYAVKAAEAKLAESKANASSAKAAVATAQAQAKAT